MRATASSAAVKDIEREYPMRHVRDEFACLDRFGGIDWKHFIIMSVSLDLAHRHTHTHIRVHMNN